MSVSRRASAIISVASVGLAILIGLPAEAQSASPTAPVSPASPSGTTKGYVFTAFWYSMYEGDDACPSGKRADGAREYMTPKMPASTAARLGPDEYKTYITDVANWGRDPKGLIPRGDEPTGASAFRANAAGLIDQCTHPGEFRDPPHYTVQGHVAYGMNLDGTDGTGAPAPGTCAHEKFVSPTGERNIDNQLYRILGCTNPYRHTGTYSTNIANDYQLNHRKAGSVTTLLEVSGVTDERNDPDVQVGIYSGANPTRYDSLGKGLPYASISIHSNPKFRATTHGKIVDGVLTTDPVDIHLEATEYSGAKSEYYIRGARLRLQLQPDGTAKGLLGGYFDVEQAFNLEFKGFGGPLRAITWGYSCPAVYAALKQYADGYPDPKTGKCTAVSTSLDVEAIPAFVVHPDEKTPQKTAQADDKQVAK